MNEPGMPVFVVVVLLSRMRTASLKIILLIQGLKVVRRECCDLRRSLRDRV